MTSPLISINDASLIKGPIILPTQRVNDDVRITSSHSHTRGQLIGTRSGLLSIESLNKKWVVPITHAIWIPPTIEHSLSSHGSFSGWSLYVRESSCNCLPNIPCVLKISNLLYELINRTMTWDINTFDSRQERLSEVLLDEVTTLQKMNLGISMPTDPILLKLAQSFLENLDDDRKIKDWACEGNMSSRTLTRKFTLETGFSFSEWKIRIRLLKALELLATGKQVKSIALELGYMNVSAFIATFKKVFGQTPKDYMK